MGILDAPGLTRRQLPPIREVAASDALVTKMKADIGRFADWCETNGVSGELGEVGWPQGTDDEELWAQFGEAQWQYLDSRLLPAFVWRASEQSFQPLQGYAPASLTVIGGPLARVTRTGHQFEQHKDAVEHRGINLGTGAAHEDGTTLTNQATCSQFSNTRDHFTWADSITAVGQRNYVSEPGWAFMGSRDVRYARLIFRWERLQRTIAGALDATEAARITAALNYAQAAGIKVILSPANFAAYWLDDGTRGVKRIIGSAELPASAFYDFWTRVANQWRAHPALLGFDLMNEPINVTAANWQTYSQGALNAIRATGATHLVTVPGGGPEFSAPQTFPDYHPAPWITDSASNFRYTTHYYAEGSTSGGAYRESRYIAGFGGSGYGPWDARSGRYLLGAARRLLPIYYSPFGRGTPASETPTFADSGQDFVMTTVGGWQTTSGALKSVSGSGRQLLLVAESNLRNLVASCTITLSATEAAPAIALFYGDINNMLYAQLAKSGTTDSVRLIKYDSGAASVLAESAAFGLVLGQTYRVDVMYDGTNMRVYIDGALAVTYALTAAEKTKYVRGYNMFGLLVVRSGSTSANDLGAGSLFGTFSVAREFN